jgi:hypothetical protein
MVSLSNPKWMARLEKSWNQFLSNPNPSVIHHLPSSFHAVVDLLRKGRPENRERFPAGTEIIFCTTSTPSSSVTSLLWNGYHELIPQGQSGQGVNLITPPPRTEVKCLELYLHSPLRLHGENELRTGIALSSVCIVETASLKILGIDKFHELKFLLRKLISACPLFQFHIQTVKGNMRCEVPTTVNIKICVFGYVTPCSFMGIAISEVYSILTTKAIYSSESSVLINYTILDGVTCQTKVSLTTDQFSQKSLKAVDLSHSRSCLIFSDFITSRISKRSFRNIIPLTEGAAIAQSV